MIRLFALVAVLGAFLVAGASAQSVAPTPVPTYAPIAPNRQDVVNAASAPYNVTCTISTDQGPGINAAEIAAQSQNEMVVLPGCSTGIGVSTTVVQLAKTYGQGPPTFGAQITAPTKVLWEGATGGTVWSVGGTSTAATHITLSDVLIDGNYNSSSVPTAAIALQWACYTCTLTNVGAQNASTAAFNMGSSLTTSGFSTMSHLTCSEPTVGTCYAWGNTGVPETLDTVSDLSEYIGGKALGVTFGTDFTTITSLKEIVYWPTNTTSTASFTVPAPGSPAALSVASTATLTANSYALLATAGLASNYTYIFITSIDSATQVHAQYGPSNLADGVGTVVPSGSLVVSWPYGVKFLVPATDDKVDYCSDCVVSDANVSYNPSVLNTVLNASYFDNDSPVPYTIPGSKLVYSDDSGTQNFQGQTNFYPALVPSNTLPATDVDLQFFPLNYTAGAVAQTGSMLLDVGYSSGTVTTTISSGGSATHQDWLITGTAGGATSVADTGIVASGSVQGSTIVAANTTGGLLQNITGTTTTNDVYGRYVNAGSTSFIGNEGSTSGNLLVGDSAYDTVINATGATGLSFGTNNTKRVGISSSGVFGITAATWADNQTCTAGQLSVDANYVYVCTAANTVKRAALSSF